MDNTNIQKILSNEQFLNELKQAIDSGKSMEYGYDASTLEDIFEEVFETDTAKQSVIELLKRYFIE